MKREKPIIEAVRMLEEIGLSLLKEYKLQYIRRPDSKGICIEIYHKKRQGIALAYTRDIEINSDLEETLFQTWKEIVVRGMTCSSFMPIPKP